MTIANVTPISTTLGSKYSVDTTTFQYPRRAVLIGDSITQRGNYSVTLTTLTVDASGLGTFTGAAHALYPGAPFALVNASIEQFNGYNTAIDRTSSSVFTAQLQKGVAGTATGATMSVTALGRFSDRNWFEMANASLAAHPFNTVLNMGASGQTTTEIAARFARDALAFAPDLIQIQGGINDIQATTAGAEATTLATLKTNFTYMIEATLAAGAIPLVVTCLPLSSTASSYTAARGQLVLKFNQWLRQLAAYTYSKMVALLGPARAAIFPALAPGIAALLAWPLLDHVPTSIELMGLFVSIVGLLWTVTGASVGPLPVRVTMAGTSTNLPKISERTT